MTGCVACGAQAVGEPLAKPEHELPTYGRALFVTATGATLLFVFPARVIAVLIERAPASLDLWSFIYAAEMAAWRLKWFALPATLLALWTGIRLYQSIRRSPARFAGSRLAHSGLAASILVTLLIATLIGVTVPERLRWRQLGIEAATRAQGYTLDRALLEYRIRYGTLPATFDDLRERLPDPDGSIAAALSSIDHSSYKPRADLAALPKQKPRVLSGAALRRVSMTSTEDTTEESISFTNYELRLPGEDKILNTPDDWTMRDGIIIKPSPAEQNAITNNDTTSTP